jgi:hypothetical protein
MQRTAPAGYEGDFALWAEAQTAALREGRWADLDVENLTEEIDGLTRRDRREIRSRLTVLMMHLLKLRYQPDRASGSWRVTIKEQAREIELILEDSPSLRRELPGFIAKEYAAAREKATDETGLPIATFPQTPLPEFERALAAALAGDDFVF